MAYDYSRMVGDELHDLAGFVEDLSEEQLEGPSLCEGWRVRDVVGHLCSGVEYSLPQVMAMTAKSGFKVPKAAFKMAVDYASTHEAADMALTIHAFADAYPQGKGKHGLTRVIKPSELQVDNLIHHQDLRRPLGLPRELPEERLVAALDAAPGITGFMHLKQRAAGLRLRPSDIDWSWGDGPSVEGPAEAMLLALSGRPAGLDELDGEGVGQLALRC